MSSLSVIRLYRSWADFDLLSDKPVLSEHASGSNWQLLLGYNGRNHNISVISSRLPKDEALEKEDRIDEMKKRKKKSPPVPHMLQIQQPPALPYAV